jgi:ankyrin repeat protein
VFLADFGISKMGLGKTLSTTRPEDPRGRTLQYCAPEVEDGRSRGRSADIFSLGAVFLEMLVAHSYFNRRQELSDALGGEGDQNRSYTYAEHLADVQKWMNSLLKDTMQDYESGDWRPQVLSLCLRMLHEDRDDRPHAYEVLDSILSIPSAAVHPCDECASQPETNDAKLLYFCRRGSLPGVNDLITRHEDLKDTVGAIHQASTHGHLSIVEALLDAGFNVNLQDYSGQTALHCAAGYEREKVVDCLIRNGGKAAIPDGEGRTALHYAAGHGSVIIATKLRSAWSDGPRATDIHGQTPLHFAAGRGHKEVVLKLLDWGATKNEHVDFADTKRRTALHFAAGYGSEEVVKLLLERGAHVKKETEKSWTALHFAAKGVRREGQYVGVIKMLLEEKPNSDLWADLIYDKTNGCKYPERLELLKEAFRKM